MRGMPFTRNRTALARWGYPSLVLAVIATGLTLSALRSGGVLTYGCGVTSAMSVREVVGVLGQPSSSGSYPTQAPGMESLLRADRSARMPTWAMSNFVQQGQSWMDWPTGGGTSTAVYFYKGRVANEVSITGRGHSVATGPYCSTESR